MQRLHRRNKKCSLVLKPTRQSCRESHTTDGGKHFVPPSHSNCAESQQPWLYGPVYEDVFIQNNNEHTIIILFTKAVTRIITNKFTISSLPLSQFFSPSQTSDFTMHCSGLHWNSASWHLAHFASSSPPRQSSNPSHTHSGCRHQPFGHWNSFALHRGRFRSHWGE